MLHRPTDLSEERVRAVERDLRELRTRLGYHVEAILEDVESDVLRNQLRQVAFSSNEMLPKRHRRPTVEIHHLVEQLHLAYGSDDATGDKLIRFTLAVQEYYDISDDLIDGDVAEGSETEVLVTNELLLPLVIRYLGRLGDDAVAYWPRHAFRMASSFADELLSDPSPEAYLDLVDKQSELFSAVTGLVAIATDCSDARVERAEAIGAAYFKHEQFLLDLEQYDADDADPWNAWHLFPADEATEHVRNWQDEVLELTDDLPDEHAERVRPLVAVDVDACREQHL